MEQKIKELESMVTDNLEVWMKVCTPPESALKKIMGGRLKGFTDINPQWRYKTLTEHYGPYGIGWKYTVDKKWTEQGTDGQIMAFADVSLYISNRTNWLDPIPGHGGSMLIAKEIAGLRCSDEAYKMAITDALSVACKMIGIGSDVYEGKMDGNKPSAQTKYDNIKDPSSFNQEPPKPQGTPKTTRPPETRPPTVPRPQTPPEQPATNGDRVEGGLIDSKQFDALKTLLSKKNIDQRKWKLWLAKTKGITSAAQIKAGEFHFVVQTIERHPEEIMTIPIPEQKPIPREAGDVDSDEPLPEEPVNN